MLVLQKQALAYIFFCLLTIFACLFFEYPLFSLQKMALPDINDPHCFYDDITAAGEEDEVVVWDFHQAATDFEDTGSISAESSEGVEQDAVRDASFPCSFSCLWDRQFAMLAYIPDLKNISRHACFYFGGCLYSGGGGGGG